MLTPFLPLFSNVSLIEYEWWLHLALYMEVCLFSALGLVFYSIITGVYEDFMKDKTGKKITFKVKPRWIVYTVAMIIIFTYIGYNGNMGHDKYADGYEDGSEYGFVRAFTTTSSDYPASMSLSLESGIFDFSSDIVADGSVHTETSITDIIIIENTDDERIVRYPTIMLHNPVTDKQGIPDDLKHISITIDEAELYHETNIIGVMLDDLYPEKQISLTINITLAVSDVDSFKDNQTYNCCIFLYQTYADYSDVVSFTIIT